MRNSFALFGAFIVSAALTTQPLLADGSGPYSAAQATNGQSVYATQCSSCHGAKLEGGEGPTLLGDTFLGHWSGKTASDLNDFVSALMPQTSPGSLSSDQYLAVEAFLLQQNGYPAGPQPLTAAKLKSVKIVKQPKS